MLTSVFSDLSYSKMNDLVNTNLYGRTDERFWDNYLKGRPRVPNSFFDRVFEYHSSHSGCFNTVNDLGAGPGTFSATLASKFRQVILTDPNKETLDVAKRYLKTTDVSQFQYYAVSAEEPALPDASIDMVFACNALHHTDVDRTVDVIAKQLKPGGTFCAALFYIAVLKDEAAQNIWTRLFELGVSDTVPKLGEKGRNVLEILNSAYDAVPIPERYFEPGAERVTINAKQGDETFCLAPHATKHLPKRSRIGTNDNLLEAQGDGWYFEADVDQLRVIHSTHPWTTESSVFEPLWEELRALLDGEKVGAYWIASRILATRNSQPYSDA